VRDLSPSLSHDRASLHPLLNVAPISTDQFLITLLLLPRSHFGFLSKEASTRH